jgi:adenylosuccinate lyase
MIERYSRPEMAGIWSEASRYVAMLKVEEAFLAVLGPRKGIPASEMKVFKGISVPALIDRAKIHEMKTGHDVIGLLSAMAQALEGRAPRLSRFLHYGLTSSDVLDTALALQLRDSADLILSGWEEVAFRLKGLSRRYELSWMAGRTHGVHAEPITFGVKLAGWHAEVLRSIDRLRRAREEVSYGKISGAVGAFTQVGPAYETEVCRRLGLKGEPISTQVVPRDRHAAFVSALALSGAAIERFATEIRHLQRTEVLEAEEPFAHGQKGSSAMPHKRNPVLCENLCGLARLLRSYALAALEDIALWHERDISHSSVERVILPDACQVLDFMLWRFKGILGDLQVHPGRMRENLERSRGLVFSQRVMLRLIDAGLGRLKAYDLVQKNAMQTWKSGKSFLEVLQSDPAVNKVLSRKALSGCFDLKGYKTSVREILKRGGVY